ncbi:ferrous iron transport protein B [Ureaplasma ceti]|uniref:Ferrous iron transport protein B n=1 Tax=Ureaplasma ceti TaxID=3119530 RepID=A0ABP9U4Q0_9BACT
MSACCGKETDAIECQHHKQNKLVNLKQKLFGKVAKKPNCHSEDFVVDNPVSDKPQQYLLIGAPNVGKSTLFNKITWQNAPVGNIDRITVSAKAGKLRSDSKIKVIDLPGVYTINPSTKDEEVVIKNLVHGTYNSVLNIIGAPSMKRDLLLTTQLLEAGVVNDIAVNMIDEVPHLNIDAFKLSRKLGVPVHLISAAKNQGIKETVKSLLFDHGKSKVFTITYCDVIEKACQEMVVIMPQFGNLNNKFLALQYMEGNVWLHQKFYDLKIKEDLDAILTKYSIQIADAKVHIRNKRNEFIEMVYNFCLSQKPNVRDKKFERSKKIDKYITNPWIGIPLFIIVVAAIYYIAFGNYAGAWITNQWTDLLSRGQDAIRHAIHSGLWSNEWIQNFVADGLLGGIFTVIGFLPYIIILFFLVSFLEQTGFLARVSLLLDKQLERFGISGKSVVTLITGIGCNIPAVMMARNCHSTKERTIVFLIAPFMSCSARLVVFVWIAQALVNPNLAWLVGLGFTAFSGLFTLLMGLMFSQTMFRNSKTFLLTELPRWRFPDMLLILKKLVLEVWDFIKRVMTIIFIVNIVMFFLMYISPTKGLILNPDYLHESKIDYSNASLLQYISIPFQYLFYPIGLGQDWRFASSLLAAAPAKELAASNLSLMFTGNSDNDNALTAVGLHNALFGQGSDITLPIATIISYLMFFSFYTPCLSTTVVMKKEGGWKKAGIHLITAFAVSYALSLFTYVGIGSVEKCVLEPQAAANGFMIVAWIVFAIALSLIVVPQVYQLIRFTLGQPMYKNYHDGFAALLIAGLGLCIVASVLTLVFIFAY